MGRHGTSRTRAGQRMAQLGLVVLAGCAATWSQMLQADSGALAHTCAAPLRPADDRNAAAMQRFLAEVDQYRECISGFVDANYAAADRHRVAAEAAALEWNAFVRDSLNAPRDFPWPPSAPNQP